MTPAGPLSVRPISDEELTDIVVRQGGSYTQLPAWARVKADWRAERLGWFTGAGELIGGVLLLHRRIPRTRYTFAYAANGPVVPVAELAADPQRWLRPLIAHVKAEGAFALRLGFENSTRRWAPGPVKDAIADGDVTAFATVPSEASDDAALDLQRWLSTHGWNQVGPTSAVAVGQPRYVCITPLGGLSQDDVLRGMNQQWRRNIKKADKLGVTVHEVGADGLDTFHPVYVETARRDGFIARPLSYFRAIHDAYNTPGSGARCRVYQAELDGTPIASAVMVTVGPTCGYLYGGSTTEHRDARGSNALQWQAIRDAMADGCTGYDFRGFNTSVAANLPMTGLLQFKLGAGAHVHELIGEHEIVLNKVVHTVYELAMGARMAINRRRFGNVSTD